MVITTGRWLYGNWCACGEFYKSENKYGTTCQKCLAKMDNEVKHRRQVVRNFLRKYDLPRSYPITYNEIINKSIKMKNFYGVETQEKIQNLIDIYNK